MLGKVLQEMVKGDVHSHADLARRLAISEGLLAQMMEDLARKGYLAAMETPSGCEGCGRCGGGKTCSSCGLSEANRLKGWALTAKGREAAERRQDRVPPR
jgi:hypothetical protein